MKEPGIERIKEVLTRGVEEVIEREHLEDALRSGKRLRVKLGIDPTASDLHLGHSVVLRKLRQFQELGHTVIFIIGDFTGQIGDPTGRSAIRKYLSPKKVRANMRGYLAQAGKIIDVKKTEIVYNSSWFTTNALATVLELSRAGTVAQVLHRADFRKRLDEDQDITLLEVLYPLFQGYDSVKVKADVELGGTDQKFNLLMGRKVQRYYKMKEQDVVMVPLLEGLDGERKMSKSFGNYVGISEPADEMFGKIMSLPDKLVGRYFELCTDVPEGEIVKLLKLHPKEFKARLAFEIVKRYRGEKAAGKAAEKFDNLFSKKEYSKIPTVALGSLYFEGEISPVRLVRALAEEMYDSNSKARGLIRQGGLKVNGEKVLSPQKPLTLKGGDVVKIGARHFFRIRL